jgi:hypothetical protein
MWTQTHFWQIIPTFIVLIALAIFLAWVLKDKSEKIRNLPFQILAVGLLVLEVIKQIDKIGPDGYDMYALPFHFCSLFLYAYPLHAFYKGKYKKTVNTIAFACGASLFFFMLVMPTVVYSESNIQQYFDSYDDFHTVTFHSYACFYFLLMVAMRVYTPDVKSDVKVIASFFSGYVVVATAMSYITEQNFHNLLRCNLQAGEDIRVALVNSIGGMGQFLYTIAMFALTIVFVLIAYFAVRGLLYLIDKVAEKLKKKA